MYKNREDRLAQGKRWREENKERNATYHRNRWQKMRENSPEFYLYGRAKSRAKLKNLEFTIEVVDIIIPTHCPILGIELYFDGKQCDATPTIDRINSSLGYIKGNIAVISNRANRLKDNGTAEEHYAIANWMALQAREIK